MGVKEDKRRHESGISSTSVDQYIPTPPDGGYGWVIVVASFFNHVIVDGIAFTFGVFYEDFLDYFNAGSGKTALVGSLLSGFYLITAPFAGSLINKFGCRPVGIIGSLIATIGFVLCSFSTNIDIMMLTYGVVGGIGLGLFYLPNVIAVSYYFQRRRALATGIAVCGSGVGCFVFAPLGKFLLDYYGWRGAMLIVAGITLQGSMFSLLLLPLEPKIKPARKPRSKTWVDRFRERNGLLNKSSHEEETKDNTQIIEKVQFAKLTREMQLSHLDSAPGSVFSSSNKLSPEKSGDTSPLKPMTASSTVDTGIGTSSAVTPATEYQQLLSEQDQPLTTNNKSAVVEAESESLAMRVKKQFELPTQSNTHQHHKSQSHGNIRCVSELCVTSQNGKLPSNVDKADLSKPLYRRDIFYSGSMIHVAEFKSQPNVTAAEYTRSVTAIPIDEKPCEKYVFCGCIPVPRTFYNTMKQMTGLSLLKNPLFFIPCLTNLFGAVGLFIPFVYIAKRAMDLGVDAQQASFLLSVIGITNTLGRLIAGALADYKWINSLLLHNMALVIGGILCILHMFCNDYILMCIFAALFGLCIATWISLTSIVLCNLLGLGQLTNAFGLLTMTRGIATFIGTPMAGFVYDATGDYNNCFQVGGIMLLAGGLLCCTLHLPCFSRRGQATKTNSLNLDSKSANGDTHKSVKIVDV